MKEEIEFSPKKKNVAPKIISYILIFLVGAGSLYALMYFFPAVTKSITNVTKVEKEVIVNENGISDAVEKVYDSVVVVETFKNDTLMASGTGFVYKKDGDKAYILTNQHVINGGSSIKVIFTNGKEEEVTVVGSDIYADIAVLSIDSSKIISVAELGESEITKVGDTAFAVGAPLDSTYSWTVTRGIISGKDRMVEVSTSATSSRSDYIMKVIQTDAAINSGNSGGPLCNSNGEVVGITSMKLISSGVEGMGFAIPIEDALSYATKIEDGEEISRPYLGVSMMDINDVSSLYGQGISISATIKTGVILASVEADSPASDASLQKGDVITKLNDTDISNVASLRYELYKYNVGDTITVTYIRGIEEKTAKIKLGKSN